MFLSVYLVGAVVVGLCLTSYLRRLYKLRNYPSAPGPFLARWTDLWYIGQLVKGKFQYWNIEQHAKNGPIIRVSPEQYSLSDPAAIKQIYGIQSTMEKGPWYKIWAPPGFPNLFAETDRNVHAGLRRALGSYYTMSAIKSYELYVNNCVNVLQENFDRLAMQGDTIDLQRWMQAYAFDVIGEVTFGSRIGFMESGCEDIDGIMDNLEKGIGCGTLTGVEPRLGLFWLFFFKHPRNGLEAFKSKLVTKRRENGAKGQQGDFFSKLEADHEKNPMQDKNSKAEQVFMANLGAGSDTTSIALTSAVFHLVSNMNVYVKLRNEIREAEERGAAHDPITFEEAQAMPYLQRVMKEALRMHSSTGLPLWRVVPEGGAEISGKYFPPGAVVGVNSWVAHYNADVFENPNQFNPDRWDPEVTDKERLKLMETCYMPFGLGTRTCIGKNISIMEMTKLIPQLVRHYDFELISPQAGQRMDSTNRWFTKQKNIFVKVRARNG